MTVMMRVDPRTRQKLMQLAVDDFGGATADETIQALIEEHEVRAMVEAVERTRQQDPAGWAEYLTEAAGWDQVSAPVAEPWETSA